MIPEDDTTSRARVHDHIEKLATMEARIERHEEWRKEQIKMHTEAMKSIAKTNDRMQSLERRLFLVAGVASGAGGIVGPWVHGLFGG